MVLQVCDRVLVGAVYRHYCCRPLTSFSFLLVFLLIILILFKTDIIATFGVPNAVQLAVVMYFFFIF